MAKSELLKTTVLRPCFLFSTQSEIIQAQLALCTSAWKQNDLSVNVLYLLARGTLPGRDIGQFEEGWLCSSGRQLYLPLGGQAGVCPHGRRCQLPDLDLPLSRRCSQGHRLRTYRGPAHLQERYENNVTTCFLTLSLQMRRNVSLIGLYIACQDISLYALFACQIKCICIFLNHSYSHEEPLQTLLKQTWWEARGKEILNLPIS